MRAILETLLWVLEGLKWIVIGAVVISWVNPDPRNPIVRFLRGMTEPLFRPFRKLLPPSRTGGLDLSPLFVIAVIYLLTRFLVAQIAYQL